MKGDLQKALDNTETAYAQLVVIANEIINEHTREVNAIVQSTVDNIENLTNDDIRSIMLTLSLKSYSFSEIKEKSALKLEVAEAIRKEAYAKKFNEIDGSVATKDNTAIIETSDEILTEAIYSLVSNLFKVKLDELHRLVDSLKTILMSRMAEAKLSAAVE